MIRATMATHLPGWRARAAAIRESGRGWVIGIDGNNLRPGVRALLLTSLVGPLDPSCTYSNSGDHAQLLRSQLVGVVATPESDGVVEVADVKHTLRDGRYQHTVRDIDKDHATTQRSVNFFDDAIEALGAHTSWAISMQLRERTDHLSLMYLRRGVDPRNDEPFFSLSLQYGCGYTPLAAGLAALWDVVTAT